MVAVELSRDYHVEDRGVGAGLLVAVRIVRVHVCLSRRGWVSSTDAGRLYI